jgi:alpha-soluble NSF attachment protein
MFKMAKKWGAAGNAFCEAASLHAKAGSKHDAATNYVDAANCFKKSDPNGAIYFVSYCNCISISVLYLLTYIT